MTNLTPSKEGKQKLTLSIDKNVIEKAREVGINISSLTEEFLRAIIFSHQNFTQDDLIESYQILFDLIRPYLKKYSASISVGDVYEENTHQSYPLELTKDGLKAYYFDGEEYNTDVKQSIDDLYTPKKILEELLPALIKAAQNNQEKMKEFEMSLRFLKALSNEKEDVK